MYESFFGVTSNPFSMTPDADMLFLTAAHRESLAGLNYAIVGRKGFAVLVGEAGTGKTTLLRKLLEMVPPSEARASVVLNPTLTAAEFLELLLLNFGLRNLPSSKAMRLHLLSQLLADADSAGTAPLLIIDEAHKLNCEVLEEIRLLTNFETGSKKLLQIILSGQPEINDLLNRPEMRQLKQRIAIRLRVGPLTPDQVWDYIGHRWSRAGGTAVPFTRDAISLVALCSKGIPRLINAICDNALLLAFSGPTSIVGARLVSRVAEDLDLESGVDSENANTSDEPDHGDSPVIFAGPVGVVTSEPLQLGTLQRYMPRESRGFFGFRKVVKSAS
jgi:general secretion pathway protein A